MSRLHGRAFLNGTFDDASIDFDQRINTIERSKEKVHQELLLVPGFIDGHVHGGAGYDFMDGKAAACESICAFHATHGTTTLAATTLSARDSDIRAAIDAAVKSRLTDGAAEIGALHFEGPFINREFAGAQDRASIREADGDELNDWIGRCEPLPIVMTVAPEIPGTLELIERFKERVIFSLGHSAATYEEGLRAFQSGARRVTHLFNAMPPLHHRRPGLIAAAVESSAEAEVIADGQHVAPAMLRVASTLFAGRLMLITDAMRACGMPEGDYKLYEHDVTVHDGAARLQDGTLAGSVLTMDRALRVMVSAGVPLEVAIAAATEAPARSLGLKGKGRLEEGFDADIVVLTPELEVVEVWSRGVRVKR